MLLEGCPREECLASILRMGKKESTSPWPLLEDTEYSGHKLCNLHVPRYAFSLAVTLFSHLLFVARD